MTGSYLFALSVVLGLAVGSVALMRFAQGRGLAFARVSPIRVVAQHSVGMGASLVLVEVDGARMLVGVSKAGVSFHSPVSECPRPLAAQVALPASGWGIEDQRPDNVSSFSAVLKRAGAR